LELIYFQKELGCCGKVPSSLGVGGESAAQSGSLYFSVCIFEEDEGLGALTGLSVGLLLGAGTVNAIFSVFFFVVLLRHNTMVRNPKK
jgi:hypothetical protein